ncbi:MAG: S8 family serine peptidase [Flavobacteriia bacterium]|nr:S8 family serine peptidase [Flavobacteriia bacterium]OIP48671.1 MAG: peptidase S8 [Flavobacteriaceae bacterium CG2_30_31_66]PIV95557.1 MAG: peptidase S8 [Flavobacteriaceae bacterium CG17_big_fil_post_rev_8_21_14_2_50_31_13]PIX14902.1 MAG: peptidase S8 [Flavobacteriaceae bacterium CG_4_8_14_3_um_filter_31_8]PIY15723.1 MAG: peptidase S8 [Flavobacteriaceae bacterium CG_4_10_14_3_um_filter_31_253]PIZ12042.1 MAG: peptidase S8 [Flavobacteriaceae bacterium CG_4_10_14_0_8_um_filter_31_99]PJC09180.
MKFIKPFFLSAFFALFLANCSSTQKVMTLPNFDTAVIITPKKQALSDEEEKYWSHADLLKDSIAGMSLEKAYRFLEGKKPIPVIVAITDSGVDIEHEDLKEVLWINKKEIKGNNIDDDKNGYVDDIHGWNFLGNASGKIINGDQLEITRLVKNGRKKFGDKKADEIAETDKAEYESYQKLEQEYRLTISQKEFEIQEMNQTQNNLERVKAVFEDVKRFVGKQTIRMTDLDSLKPTSLLMVSQVDALKNILEKGATEEDLLEYLQQIKDYKKELEKGMKGYDLDLNARENLGDNLYDITDKFYGNNNVIGNKDLEKHGTHVAGIVAASRNNNKGAKGVANSAKIMTVRVVPDGDEHDKDVALGIRYAVDNGAKIINTSFGKRYSPNKEWVFDAIAYAAKKDVLIVNAAGNDGKDIDIRETYPNDSKDLKTEFVDNVITVGASSLHYNEELVASFSNYGKINVDIFAPGVDIYSTVPKNEYEPLSGTSMAAPSTSGVAALIRAYYPNLTAKEVKYILMNSGVKVDFEVLKPGSQKEENPLGELVPFADLSFSGRIVNAYNALQLADYLSRKKQ